MENPIQTDFIRWIVFLPLLGAIVNGLLGAKIQKSMGKGAIGLIACAPVVIAFGLSVWAFFILVGLEPEKRFLIDNLYRWIDLGSLKVDMAFMVDPLSAVMILIVTGIGGLIHIYATGYMHDDKAFWRFFAYLNLFTAAMLTLVLGDSLLLLFVGWEGVGLCSYALIGFWYTDHANARAGNKAFIVNRVGDFGFVLGMFLLFWSLDAQGHGTLTFRDMVKWAPSIKDMMIWGMPVATVATLFLFVGATGKSAQIPLVCLASRRHGRADAGERAHPCRHHGDRRRLHDRAHERFLFHGAGHFECDRRHRRRHRAGRRNDCAHPVRHQESPSLFHGQPARLHVYRRRRRRLCRGGFSFDDPRVLQSLLVPRLRQRDPRHAS